MFKTTQHNYYYCIVVAKYDEALAVLAILRQRLFIEENFGTNVSVESNFLLNKHQFESTPKNWKISFESHRDYSFDGSYSEAIEPAAVENALRDFLGKIEFLSYRQTTAKTDATRC